MISGSLGSAIPCAIFLRTNSPKLLRISSQHFQLINCFTQSLPVWNEETISLLKPLHLLLHSVPLSPNPRGDRIPIMSPPFPPVVI